MSLVLHKVFKLLLQSLTGKEYATLHRTQRQIEFFGNFPILKSGLIIAWIKKSSRQICRLLQL